MTGWLNTDPLQARARPGGVVRIWRVARRGWGGETGDRVRAQRVVLALLVILAMVGCGGGAAEDERVAAEQITAEREVKRLAAEKAAAVRRVTKSGQGRDFRLTDAMAT